MAPKFVTKQVSAVKNPAPLPPWWALATVGVGILFFLGLFVSGVRGGQSDTPSVPAYALGPGTSQTVQTPSDIPSSAAEPVVDQTPEISVNGTRRLISRSTSVLNTALYDDGNTEEVPYGQSVAEVPNNVLATAVAGFWASVDPDVAKGLVVSGQGSRVIPEKNWQNASLKNTELVDAGPGRWTFQASMDRDGAGTEPAQVLTVTVLETDGGYLIEETL